MAPPSPTEIREVVKALSGIDATGVITERDINGRHQYIFTQDGHELACFQQGRHWVLTGPSPNGGIRLWHDDPNLSVANRQSLLDHFIKPKDAKLSPIFVHEFVDMRPDIRRTLYRTVVGLVHLHSRRTEHGIEIFIEVNGTPPVLSMLWRDGVIDPSSICKLDQYPF